MAVVVVVMVVVESEMADGRVSGKLPPKVACKEPPLKGLWNRGDKVSD